jgi:hypothetical protein
MKKNLPLIYCLLLSAFLATSCQIGTSGSWKDENINKQIRDQISPLDNKLFNSIMTKNIPEVKKLLSPALLSSAGSTTDSLINKVAGALSPTGYNIVNEYYVKNTATDISNTVFSGLGGGSNDYAISYKALNNEMYVSVIKSKTSPTNALILAIYGKYGDEWKINILHIGEYSTLEKTAPDYYEDAVKLYNSGDMLDAAHKMMVASPLSAPGGEYFKYQNNDKMKDFYSKLLKTINTTYKFPFVVTGVKTHPQIFSVYPQYIDELGHKGIFPAIRYISSINIDDTIALKAENQELHKSIGKIFKGIDQNNNFILYKAFNKMPNAQTNVDQYGFIQKTK